MNVFMIAGTNSGVGKTTITLALISALKRAGLSVQPFKVGPDFIDPGYHTFASGFPCVNLDGWMLSEKYNKSNFSFHLKNKDIGIVEGVMGFYDGFSTTDNNGSSAQIAIALGLPVILIVDGKSIARSAAAIVKGFEVLEKNVNITGVIFNNVSGDSHYNYLKESVKHYCNAEPLGYFQKDDFKPLKSRHLGLVTIEDNSQLGDLLSEYGEIAEKRIDIKALLDKTEYAFSEKSNSPFNIKKYNKTINVSIAKDNAFSFYYFDNIKILEYFGANITFFSPLKDKAIPCNTDLLYLGGGYPELYAEQLSENRSMLSSIADYSDSHGFIYAECGGFIYLTEGVFSLDGKFFPFTKIFKDKAIMYNRLKALGYAEIETKNKSFFGKQSLIARGHEFHYSYLENNGENLEKIYSVKMRKHSQNKDEGYICKNTLGSYIHLHFGSNLNLVKSLFENLN